MNRQCLSWQLIFLVLCSSVPACRCETCEEMANAQRCVLRTSQPGEWFSGLDPKSQKAVQILLIFDTVEVPLVLSSKPFATGVLVMNVTVQHVEICNRENSTRSEPRNCLDSEDVTSTINDILKLFQDKVVFFSLHLKSYETLRYSPHLRVRRLTDLVISGFRLAFTETLVQLSGDLISVTFENTSINSLNEIDFKGLEKVLEILKLNHNRFKDLSSSQRTAGLKKLKTLELQFNDIARIDADNFLKSLKKLAALHLHGNRISFVHEFAFDGLKNLKYLSLGDNRLVSVPLFGSLDGSHFNLEELILRNNEITSFDNEASEKLPKMLYLDLRHTCIANFDFLHLESLKSLKFSNSCVETLKFELGRSSLKSLHLAGNRLEKFDENLTSLLNNSDLDLEVDFSDNPWCDCDVFLNWYDRSCSNRYSDRGRHKCRVGQRNSTVTFVNHESFVCFFRLNHTMPVFSTAATLHLVCLNISADSRSFAVAMVCLLLKVLRFLV